MMYILSSSVECTLLHVEAIQLYFTLIFWSVVSIKVQRFYWLNCDCTDNITFFMMIHVKFGISKMQSVFWCGLN